MPVRPEVFDRLRAGKAALRAARRQAPLHEKLREIVRAQHLYVQIVGSRRPLTSLQRPWDVISDVRESVIIRPDGFEPTTATASSARAHWLRPVLQRF